MNDFDSELNTERTVIVVGLDTDSTRGPKSAKRHKFGVHITHQYWPSHTFPRHLATCCTNLGWLYVSLATDN